MIEVMRLPLLDGSGRALEMHVSGNPVTSEHWLEAVEIALVKMNSIRREKDELGRIRYRQAARFGPPTLESMLDYYDWMFPGKGND